MVKILVIVSNASLKNQPLHVIFPQKEENIFLVLAWVLLNILILIKINHD